jgi:hypothetical protein
VRGAAIERKSGGERGDGWYLNGSHGISTRDISSQGVGPFLRRLPSDLPLVTVVVSKLHSISWTLTNHNLNPTQGAEQASEQRELG